MMLVRTVLAALLSWLALAVGPVDPAQAHHGWQEFDTGRPFYLSGTVTDVRWGNPHPEIRLTTPNEMMLGVSSGREDRSV
jgi:hypothetical protein